MLIIEMTMSQYLRLTREKSVKEEIKSTVLSIHSDMWIIRIDTPEKLSMDLLSMIEDCYYIDPDKKYVNDPIESKYLHFVFNEQGEMEAAWQI